MNDTPPDEILSPTLARRVDQVCNVFEQACKAGQRPQIEDYLADWGEVERPPLIRELISLEIHYAHLRGETAPLLADYQRRFPTLETSWLDQAKDDLPTPGFRAGSPNGAGADIGRRLGNYELLEEIGRGGMGVVYKARQLGLNRVVAVKIILSKGHADSVGLERFRGEAEAVAQLRHPHIVQVYEIGEQDGQPFFSMEYVEGGSLARKLAGTPLLPREAAQLLAQLAEAAQAAHHCGIIHRDLKPANILLGAPLSNREEGPGIQRLGTPKIADFGMAKRLDAELTQTSAGAVVGTPSYMAPEQARGESKSVNATADVYSLGAILYEMLTGRPPFKGATGMDTVLQVLEDEPVPPARLVSRLPRDLETICLKCLEKSPRRRYPSAAALAAEIKRFLCGEPIVARPVGQIERAAKWIRRKPMTAGMLAVSGLLLLSLVGLALAWLSYHQVQAARERAEFAREEVDKQRQLAEAAQEDAQKQRKLAESLEYFTRVQAAHLAWQDNHVAAAIAHLDRCQADLRSWEYHYVLRLCQESRNPIRGSISRIARVRFSSDGKRIVAGCDDGAVKVWDALTGQEALMIPGNSKGARWFAFSPDGNRIAVVAHDGTLRVLEVDTGQELLAIKEKGVKEHYGSVTFSADGKRIAISLTNTDNSQFRALVTVWDLAARREQFTLMGPAPDVHRLVFSPDSKRMVASCTDGTIRVWNAENGESRFTLRTASWPLVMFSPDGKRIACTAWETLKVFDAEQGQELFALKGHTHRILEARFSPDGKRLATAGEDRTVIIWDTEKGRKLLSLQGHLGAVFNLAFSPDGKHIVSAGNDKTLRVWHADKDQDCLTLKGHTAAITGVAFSPDGRKILSRAVDGVVKLWDVARNQEALIIADRGDILHVSGVAFSPDGSHVASVDGRVQVSDAQKHRDVFFYSEELGSVSNLAYSPDGKHIAVGGHGETVYLLDAASGRTTSTFKGHTAAITSVAFNNDGSHIASGSEDRTVRVWHRSSGKEILTLIGHSQGVLGVAFSPDGKRIASSSEDKTIKLWDVATGKDVMTLKGHTARARCVAFSPDGKRIVSGSGDRTVKVWNAINGEALLILQGHGREVTSVAYSPDGKRIVTASGDMDNTMKFWDSENGHEGITLKADSSFAYGDLFVAFSTDGNQIVSGGDNCVVQIWDATPLPQPTPSLVGKAAR